MSETVKLHKAFSLVQERLTKLFDESGVKRSFTVPYVDGEPAVVSRNMSASENALLQSTALRKACIHPSCGE